MRLLAFGALAAVGRRQLIARAMGGVLGTVSSTSRAPCCRFLCAPARASEGGDNVYGPDPNNIFARILRGEAPADKVDDDGDLFTFCDKRPASTIHYLVIPKFYIRDASVVRAGLASPAHTCSRDADAPA